MTGKNIIAGTFSFSKVGCSSPGVKRGKLYRVQGTVISQLKVMTARDLSIGGREMSQHVPS